MNPEDIKVGETYNVRVKVVKKTDLFIHTKTCVNTVLDNTYLFEYAESEVFSPIDPADGTKSAEPAPDNLNILEEQPKMIKLITNGFTPSEASHARASAQAGKYDPCRKFRAGDIVEPCQVKGRWLSEAWKNRAGIRFIVATDEDKDGTMWVKDPDSVMDRYTDAIYFQLVTPVEAQAPYSVHEGNNEGEWCVYRDWGIETQKLVALFYPTYPHAKAAAEAERDRLNAAHRKELMK